MWSLRFSEKDGFYLTYDRERRRCWGLRGSWEFLGPISNDLTKHCVRVNKKRGLFCVPDDEGDMRVLVLED